MPRTLPVARVEHDTIGLVPHWQRADQFAGRTAQRELHSQTLLVLSEVRVDGPRHDIMHPMAKLISLLELGIPRRRVAQVASLPLSYIGNLRPACRVGPPYGWKVDS